MLSFSTLGTVFAVLSNEWVLQSQPVDGPYVNGFKLANSICTALAVASVYRYHWLKDLFIRIEDHLNRGQRLNTDVNFLDVFQSRLFLIEAVAMGLHLPPFCTFIMESETMGDTHLYRGETVLCLINTLRLYSVFRVIRCIYAYICIIPPQHNLEMFGVVTCSVRSWQFPSPCPSQASTSRKKLTRKPP